MINLDDPRSRLSSGGGGGEGLTPVSTNSNLVLTHSVGDRHQLPVNRSLGPARSASKSHNNLAGVYTNLKLILRLDKIRFFSRNIDLYIQKN